MSAAAAGPGGVAWVVHADMPRPEHGRTGIRRTAAQMAEAVGLAQAVIPDVREAESLTVRKARPATLFGPGQLAAIAERLDSAPARPEVVVVNTSLSAIQQRNLERAWGVKILDRTALILEIFGARARTREGRLQVELAALSYQRSRLVRTWTHLERQRGGLGFVGGPGESQLEVDRRRIDERITRLRRELAAVARTRGLHRAARRRVPYPIVVLVGYTNAGKSTLFNRLTGASVTTADQLFATLDPTMRALALPSGRTVILSDTVGFVSDLPTDLVTAFRATLEEVVEADLILHVRDTAHLDSAAQSADVAKVLADLGIAPDAEGRVVEVHNKIDLLEPAARAALQARLANAPDKAAASAHEGAGMAGLLERMDRLLGAARQVMDISLPTADGAALAWLHRHAEIVDRRYDGATTRIRAVLDPADAERFQRRFPHARACPPDQFERSMAKGEKA